MAFKVTLIRDNILAAAARALLFALCSVVALLSGCGEQRFQPLMAADFELPVLGQQSTASPLQYRGKVVYLTFWASWCIPCRQEMPYLQQLWERHKDNDFEVLAINVDEDQAAAEAFVAQYQLGFQVLLDPQRRVGQAYKVPGYPTHYIVDRRGNIRFSGLGFNLGDVGAISQEVETLLAEE